MAKMKYWDIRNILSKHAKYNVIFGERSNGKTYGCLQYGLEQFFEHGSRLGIIRRWEEDFRGKQASTMFDALIDNGVIFKLSKGRWNSVLYQSHRWYLCKRDSNNPKNVTLDDEPFAYAFALSSDEHYKSSSYPKIRTILFDEFLTRNTYLPDEFVKFTSILSTIIRLRDDVTIFMCGNTVNQYSPYFSEMGLTNIKKMVRGTIDVYSYGDSGLTVAVEYSDFPTKEKKSNMYFAFNNPKLEMIRSGAWEMDIYPHLPIKYKSKDIIYKYYIEFDDELLQCEIISIQDEDKNDLLFTYIHRKTTEIKEDGYSLVYSTVSSPLPTHRKKITKPTSDLEKEIIGFFVRDKVFYQSNEIGEIVRNYLQWCK